MSAAAAHLNHGHAYGPIRNSPSLQARRPSASRLSQGQSAAFAGPSSSSSSMQARDEGHDGPDSPSGPMQPTSSRLDSESGSGQLISLHTSAAQASMPSDALSDLSDDILAPTTPSPYYLQQQQQLQQIQQQQRQLQQQQQATQGGPPAGVELGHTDDLKTALVHFQDSFQGGEGRLAAVTVTAGSEEPLPAIEKLCADPGQQLQVQPTIV